MIVPGAPRSCGDGGATRVWVVRERQGDVARASRSGPTRGEHVEIRSGLEGGESVVLAPPGRKAARYGRDACARASA